MTEKELLTIKATLRRERYFNPLTNWGVFVFDYQKSDLTVTGLLVGVEVGEEVELTGYFQYDVQWGREFKLESFKVELPTTLKGIEGYLGSGLLKGVGKATAKAIVSTLGEESLNIIANEPALLRKVPKIGAKKLAQIVDSYNEKRHLQDLIVFLQTYDIGIGQAVKIDHRYGKAALGVIRDNPYVLAEEVHGIGFKTADKIALSMGLDANDSKRLIAALQAVINEAGDEGHLYLTTEQLVEKAALMISVPPEMLREQVDVALKNGKLCADAADLAPGGAVLSTTPLYTSYYYELETKAAELLVAILATKSPKWLEAPDRALKEVQTRLNITLAAQQYAAVLTAAQAKAMVITGGPGTGKTTIIRAIVTLAKMGQRKVLLTAPTGRAAKRMEETTKETAATIHRLLEYSPQLHDFTRNKDNPLACDILIIDEMSMVDMALIYHLLMAVPPEAQVVFVGDIDQLPSVGPGNVLRDIITSRVLPVVKLTEVFRQAEQSLIVQNAHRINQGQMPKEAETGATSDFYFVEREAPEAVQAALVELICKRIPAKFGFDPLNDVQLLTPMRRGSLGVVALNELLQKSLNKNAKGRGYAVGDKVMQLKNDYEKDVFNGDIGRIVHIKGGETPSLEVDFDGHIVSYPADNLDELTLAYATTIHKSQGSEYPAVLIVLHGQQMIMLQRNLLYTAVTRGKKLVMIVGNKKAIGMAIRADKAPLRQTKFAARLEELVKK